jgi:hypothetical protein
VTSTRPVKTLAACLLAAGSFAVAAPAIAGTSTPPAPGSSVPAGAANQVVDLGVPAPTPELIADFQATGFEDPAAIFADYGFTTVPTFPIIANAVLYQVMGDGSSQDPALSSQGLDASFVVTGTDADLQRFTDAIVAAIVPDPTLYDVSAGNGTDDTIAYVTADISPIDYGTLPTWSIQTFTDTADPGPVMIAISYEFSGLPAAVPLPPHMTTAHGADVAAMTAAGFVGTGFRFTVGVNEFGGFPIDISTLSFRAPGVTFDVAATTACAAFGLTAAVSEYDDETWTCESPEGTEPSMTINARTAWDVDTDSFVDIDYDA